MPVEYGLLSANLNLPVEQMVQIKTQQDAERARLGLAYAAMQNQQSQAMAANAAQRIQAENARIAAEQMQAQKIAAEKAMQEAQLKQRQEEALLPYQKMTQGQRVQMMGYRDAERERQVKHQQFQQELQRQLEHDAAKQKFDMLKLEYEKMEPKSAEAKFAYDLARETDPQKRQFLIDQHALAQARANESITYNKDGTTTITRGANAGQGTGNSALVNKLKEEQVAADEALSDLQKVRDLWKPSFSTSAGQTWEKGKGWVSRHGGDMILTKGAKEDLTQFETWKKTVNQTFLKYKKETTGTAGPMYEMDRIEDSIYSTKDDPIAFKAAMDQAEDKLKRYTIIRQKAIQEGLTPGTKAFGQYIQASGWGSPVNDKPGGKFAGSRFEVK